MLLRVCIVCVCIIAFTSARLPYTDLILPTYDVIDNNVCRQQGVAYQKATESLTSWAMQMFDSAAKAPVGLLVSNGYELGSFDECLSVSADLREEGGMLRGQYCLVDVYYHNNISSPHLTMDYDPLASMRNELRNKSDPSQIRRERVSWAICVPASCGPGDLQISLSETVHRLRPQFNLQVEVKPHMCQTQLNIDERQQFNSADYTVMLAALILLFLVIASSFYDNMYKKHCAGEQSLKTTKYIVALPVQFLLCFSARRNLAYLCQLNLSQTGLDCIHGLRLLFMILAIACHRLLMVARGPVLDTTKIDEGFHQWSSVIVFNGMLVIDAFFVYSGLLTAYYLPIELDQRKQLNPFLIYLYRFIRLTPLYMAVLLFQATLLSKFGSGPLWPQSVGLEQQRCAENFWLNLLYLNNYINTDQMCMFQSWYLSVDTHLFMVAVLVIYCLWRWPTVGYVMMALFAFCSIFIPFAVNFHTKTNPYHLFYHRTTEGLPSSEEPQEILTASHMRAGPYVVGATIGYFLYKIRDLQFTLPKAWLYIGHTLCFLVCLTVLYTGHMFYLSGAAYNTFFVAVYGATYRMLWGSAIAINVVLLKHGRIEWIHKLLTWPPLVPVSRLTYCAYLVHSLPHLYEMSEMRTLQALSYYTAAWMFTGDILFTFLISLFLCLLVEAPFRGVERIIFGIRKAPLDNKNQPTQSRKNEAP